MTNHWLDMFTWTLDAKRLKAVLHRIDMMGLIGVRPP